MRSTTCLAWLRLSTLLNSLCEARLLSKTRPETPAAASPTMKQEIIISIKIGKEESKDEILQNYLNTIYYGRGAYGIQTAAKAYFNKDVSKLNAAEGALLASVIRGPSYYDPGLGAEQKKNAESRVDYVLDGKALEATARKKDAAPAKAPETKPEPAKPTEGPPAPAPK